MVDLSQGLLALLWWNRPSLANALANSKGVAAPCNKRVTGK
jgi:hypothetical protein